MSRLPVRKTYKLFIGGAFPRSESGRTYDAEGANVARGSRKDLRDAVRIARQAGAGWSGMTAYNRGQVVYRVAEMMEARRAELAGLSSGADEVERAIDRVVWYAGWADKLAQVVGSANPVTGADGDLAELERLGAENVKRIVRGRADGQSPYEIAAFLELKTVWHPIGM